MQNCLDAYSTDLATTARRPELGAGDGRGIGASDDQETYVARLQDQRSVLAAFATGTEEVGASFLEKTSITAVPDHDDQNVGGKRPLTMAEIRNPDYLSNRAAESRQEFQRAMAAKKAKISEPTQSV
jgi:hypothetical protein